MQGRARSVISVFLLLAVSVGCGSGLPPGPGQPVTAIVGVKLIDGSTRPPVDDAVIVVEGTRIQLAGPRSHTPVPKGDEIVDGMGKTAIPGLVDAGAGYSGDRASVERSLRFQLENGVTAVGTHTLAGAFEGLLADLRAGRAVGARVYPQSAAASQADGTTNPTGWEMHEQMAQLVDAGRRPLEAIRAVTRDNARHIAGEGAEFGIIEAGRIADLILLDADPLLDIRNTRRISRVMQTGRWVEPSDATKAR